jgi:DNA N-6-adenine-methyltransferase (Dam)
MTLGSHQNSVGRSQTHITPKRLIDVLGPFDLDPAAADPRPWSCAELNFTEADNGLAKPWRGRVWLNPPFDRYQVGHWIERLAQHGCGTTLLHARTEAEWFEPIWQHASAILFMADRIKFFRPDGSEQPANSGAPPILASFGDYDRERLANSGIAGALVTNWRWQTANNAMLACEAETPASTNNTNTITTACAI